MSLQLSAKDKLIEAEIRQLATILENSGFAVRREQLSRGRSYRVKSGECVYAGDNVLFVDKRLPIAQQLSVLLDYLMDLKLEIPTEVLHSLSAATKSLLGSQQLKSS